jgi:hypothetical protein
LNGDRFEICPPIEDSPQLAAESFNLRSENH